MPYKCVICGYEQESDDFCSQCIKRNYPARSRGHLREKRERTKLEIFKDKLDDFSDAVADFFQYDGGDIDDEALLEVVMDRFEEELIEMFENKG